MCLYSQPFDIVLISLHYSKTFWQEFHSILESRGNNKARKKNIFKETTHWNRMIDLTPLKNYKAHYTYVILCPRFLFILDNCWTQETSPFSPLSFFVDIKNAYCRDILNIYQLRCCYNILLSVMFYFDLYLMHKCIHMIVYTLSIPQLNGSAGKRLITPIN